MFVLQAWASLHGHLVEVPLTVNVSEWEEDIEVCVGAEVDSNASFTGFVTGVTLQAGDGKGELTPANCSVLLDANELTVPLNESWKTMGPVFVLEENLDDPCHVAVHTLLLTYTWDYDRFLRLCRSLGGHFPTEEEAATGEVEAFNCTSWASEEFMREEDPEALCPVLVTDGGVGRRACLSELECSVCLVPVGLRYTLFGSRTEFDRHYNLTSTPNGTFHFQGKTSTFQREASGWSLQSKLHRKTLHLNNSVSVMGRRAWHSHAHDHVHDHAHSHTDTLTFTVCNALQFSSDDGVCLLRSERCDGHTNSLDKSDEKECGVRRLVRKDAYYDTSDRPSQGQDKLTMHVLFKVMMVNKISTEKGLANVEINIRMKWEDDRLTFLDSRKGRNVFPCEEVWTPNFMFYAGYDVGPQVRPSHKKTLCYMYWSVKPHEQYLMEDPFMGKCGAGRGGA